MMHSLAGVAAGIMAFFGASTTALGHLPDQRGHATSTVPAISCVAPAVAAREQALGAGMTTYTQNLNAAYAARATALASAYSQNTSDAARKAVKSAWATFGAALRIAHKDWVKAQKDAWGQFRTAVKACGPSASAVADSSNAGMEESAATQ